MVGILQDIRFGARVLRKNPGFTSVAVLSLALGIGANTAIFQLLNAVRLKTLPVNNAEQLVRIQLKDDKGTRGNHSSYYSAVTNPIWEKIRDRQQGFEEVTAWGTQTFNMAQGGEIRSAKGLWVSGGFFNLLGVRAQQGRLLSANDDQRGCASPNVVISNAFWQREFGGKADAVGRKISLADQQFEIGTAHVHPVLVDVWDFCIVEKLNPQIAAIVSPGVVIGDVPEEFGGEELSREHPVRPLGELQTRVFNVAAEPHKVEFIQWLRHV